MKTFFIALTIVATSAMAHAKMERTAMSGRPTTDGCGLGWEVNDSHTMVGTTVRGTTNFFVPPTFGMTSGTLGCEQLSFAANDKEAASFVATNYQSLKSELAVGHGEYVNAMVESFGCDASRAPAISSKIQKRYNAVVAPTKNATELFNNLKAEVGHCG